MNLGNPVTEPARRLKDNKDWEELRAGLSDYASSAMNSALSAPPEMRVDATAYARAVRDVWVSLEAATAGVNPNQVKKPGSPKHAG
jgi:hypothetical protein